MDVSSIPEISRRKLRIVASSSSSSWFLCSRSWRIHVINLHHSITTKSNKRWNEIKHTYSCVVILWCVELSRNSLDP
jgi:hypothetical protein